MLERTAPPAAGWAQPIKRLHAPDAPAGILNLNVDGRRLNGPLQGFGQLWQRAYRVPLGSDVSPEQVVQTWKERFGEFWPEGNRFFEPSPQVEPGDVALINLSPLPGPLTLSTGIAVIYADETSFTFMAPEGHMYAGWITFSAFGLEGVTLTRYFAAADESADERKVLAEVAVSLMFSGVKPLGERLTMLPFGPEFPERTAAPTFFLQPQGVSLLPHREAAWLVIEERLREAAEFGRRVEGPPELGLARVCASLDRYADKLAQRG